MKHQASFSLTDKSTRNMCKVLSAAILLGFLRVNRRSFDLL